MTIVKKDIAPVLTAALTSFSQSPAALTSSFSQSPAALTPPSANHLQLSSSSLTSSANHLQLSSPSANHLQLSSPPSANHLQLSPPSANHLQLSSPPSANHLQLSSPPSANHLQLSLLLQPITCSSHLLQPITCSSHLLLQPITCSSHSSFSQSPAALTSFSQSPAALISFSQSPAALISSFSQSPAALISSFSQSPAALTSFSQSPAALISSFSQSPAALISFSQSPAALISFSQSQAAHAAVCRLITSQPPPPSPPQSHLPSSSPPLSQLLLQPIIYHMLHFPVEISVLMRWSGRRTTAGCRTQSFKQRLDKDLKPVTDEAEKHELGKADNGEVFDPSSLDPNRCESCYGAETEDLKCCNTCDDVREAYRRRGWAFKNADTIEQCKREGFSQKMQEQKNEGCQVYGFLEVNKVAGNFHFAPGKSFQQSHVHVHAVEIHDLQSFGLDNINMTHMIRHLSFGKDYPGIVNPLDGTNVTAPQGKVQTSHKNSNRTFLIIY
ncbi:hypothetical protein WMY93_011339 [Mugilogobius chulae]|uniref:Endoplasmic reticulum-Golgi intermediate compartment protein n=1 Tax=Mugilogobius chulae TaxID=88201 RepID=A0AAW0PED6_9GOBI